MSNSIEKDSHGACRGRQDKYWGCAKLSDPSQDFKSVGEKPHAIGIIRLSAIFEEGCARLTQNSEFLGKLKGEIS